MKLNKRHKMSKAEDIDKTWSLNATKCLKQSPLLTARPGSNDPLTPAADWSSWSCKRGIKQHLVEWVLLLAVVKVPLSQVVRPVDHVKEAVEQRKHNDGQSVHSGAELLVRIVSLGLCRWYRWSHRQFSRLWWGTHWHHLWSVSQ